MPLRDYQTQMIADLREHLRAGDKSVLMQLATGGGKTPIVAELVALAQVKNPAVRIWFVVPRKKLLSQGSKTLQTWGIAHGRIDAKHHESSSFNVHVVSKDTLMRRLDKIKDWPDMLIFDECHLYYDAQKKIIAKLPEHALVFGMTATPERLDNKPLSDIYQAMINGPLPSELTESGYLAPIRYFAPDVHAVADWKFTGMDVKEDELEKILVERAIYGDMLKYYKLHAEAKPTLVFCRSIPHAENVAHRFREAGYRFEPIEGSMPPKKQEALIQAFESGELDGLTSCDLCTYGVDIKGARVAIHLRPTKSRAIYYQINGRVMRPDTDDCLIIDHVGNIAMHGHPYDDRPWNFEGKQLRAAKKTCERCEFADGNAVLHCRRFGEKILNSAFVSRASDCPYYIQRKQKVISLCNSCWQYTTKTPCPNCGEATKKTRKELEERDAELVELAGPVKIAQRPQDERQTLERKIADLTHKAHQGAKFDTSALKELIQIAHETDRNVMWVYHQCKRPTARMVNVELLDAIARLGVGKKGGPSTEKKINGWLWYKRKELKERG